MRKLVVLVLLLGVLGVAAIAPSHPQTAAQSDTNTVMVPMPDGVRLATTLVLPDGAGPFPTLLMRTPYGRTADMDDLTASGIAVASQDVRGRYDAEGEFTTFRDDRADGQAMLDWITAQPWSNGVIMTFGGSAIGITQYMLAAGATEALKCQWVEVATPDIYSMIYENGVYREALIDGWLGSLNEREDLVQIRQHPTRSAFWDSSNITNDFADVGAVAFHVGGFYDIFAKGTIDAFLGYNTQSRAAGRQHLIMGPWTHAVNDSAVGDYEIPAAVLETYESIMFAFLDACLLDGTAGLGTMADIDAMPPVMYFTIGAHGEPDAPGNEWRTAETWPPAGATDTRLYLQADGTLSYDVPTADAGGTTYQYDPTNTVPTICGANLSLPAGACDQSPIESRDDVILFDLPVLAEPLEVTGDVYAEIWIETDVVDTDIAVRVTDVYPNGDSMLVMDSIMRARYHNDPTATNATLLTPGEPVLLRFEIGPTSYIFNEGHQIRISVSSSNAPRFAPNPNTGADFLEPGQSGVVATTTILHNAAQPSAIVVPVR